MDTVKKSKGDDFDVKIGLKNDKEWTDDEMAKLKAFVKNRSNKISPDRRLKNEMLSIKYQMENYVNDESIKKITPLDDFLNDYLKILNITLKKFAQAIDTTDANLKKYISSSGERKFNTDLALKFASFFHTTPELWLRVNIKNELLSLSKEKKQATKYRKYDYEKVMA